jgi:predicted anti-sigma-YlaC factor YlaD
MNCPDTETLLLGQLEASEECLQHLKQCPNCAALLEEHRQLEKDLFRLADPLPPFDLVAKVMQRVAAEPLPVRHEVRVGFSILVATLMATVLSFVATRGPIGLVGASVARALVSFKTTLFGLHNAVQVAWSTTTIPLAVSLSLVLFLSLVGLRRVTPVRTAEIEVLP